MRGMVFWKSDELTLLNERLEMRSISDYDGIYSDMSKTKAEIVEIDENELLAMVDLKSIFGMTFFKFGTQECLAEEAILYCLDHEPETLIQRMHDNL